MPTGPPRGTVEPIEHASVAEYTQSGGGADLLSGY